VYWEENLGNCKFVSSNDPIPYEETKRKSNKSKKPKKKSNTLRRPKNQILKKTTNPNLVEKHPILEKNQRRPSMKRN